MKRERGVWRVLGLYWVCCCYKVSIRNVRKWLVFTVCSQNEGVVHVCIVGVWTLLPKLSLWSGFEFAGIASILLAYAF